jgi:pilus assembly protein Flp/PilA
MTTFFSAARSFWNDEQGVTAIEYGLIAALIGVAAIVGMGLVGGALQKKFSDIAALLK